MAGTPSNLNIGYRWVYFNKTGTADLGTDLGYTMGGVRLTMTIESTDIEVDQEGSPVDIVVTGHPIIVEVPMAETNYQKLVDLFPGSMRLSGGGYEKLHIKDLTGESLLDEKGKLTLRMKGDDDGTHDITIWNCIPIPDLNQTFEKNGVQVWVVTFRGLGGIRSDGVLMTFGDLDATS